jgi:hypothetical protein
VAKATKNKKSKEGRHVGLDFYDLLIEALIDGLEAIFVGTGLFQQARILQQQTAGVELFR